MEPLADPYNDRVVKTVPIPPSRPLSQKLMYPDESKPSFNDPLGKPTIPNLQVVRKHLVD